MPGPPAEASARPRPSSSHGPIRSARCGASPHTTPRASRADSRIANHGANHRGGAPAPSRGPSSDPHAGPTLRRPRLALALATAGGAGYAPKAPGTAGAAVGVALALGLARWGMLPYALTTALLLALGIWAAGEAERAFARHDDGRIVIDEVVGQLVALIPLAACGPFGPAHEVALAAAGFAAFRLFDIWKPGPVRWAERFAGGTGVMADDVVAGALGAVLVGGLAAALRGGGA